MKLLNLKLESCEYVDPFGDTRDCPNFKEACWNGGFYCKAHGLQKTLATERVRGSVETAKEKLFQSCPLPQKESEDV